MIGLLNLALLGQQHDMSGVSIRRADDWAFEPLCYVILCYPRKEFQSAGRMIGLLNSNRSKFYSNRFSFQSAGRMIGLLNDRTVHEPYGRGAVSIRRADDWAFEPFWYCAYCLI